jgi:two-component sensor histidine kinase
MANKAMTAAEVPETPTPLQRSIEADHRIANELGQLAALLARQIKSAESGPAMVPRASLTNALRLHHGRLLGISRLHHAISRQPDQNVVDLTQMLTDLFGEFEACGVFEHRLRLEWTLSQHCVVDAAQASAMTLAFSEIVTNALKYAHPTGLPVEMTVSVALVSDGTVALSISDDGVGLPEGFVESRHAGVGLKLVRSLVESVGGRIAMSSSELGLSFRIDLPRSSAPPRSWRNE